MLLIYPHKGDMIIDPLQLKEIIIINCKPLFYVKLFMMFKLFLCISSLRYLSTGLLTVNFAFLFTPYKTNTG